ncbi:MAG: M48 family metallopeptidase [Candidatus Obscuribacter sp.]|nr:M48 family metallopeptidase [Candidatus Obscuribacter sp.]
MASALFDARLYRKDAAEPVSVKVQIESHRLRVLPQPDSLEPDLELDYGRAQVELAGQDKNRIKVQPLDASYALIFQEREVLASLALYAKGTALAKQADLLYQKAGLHKRGEKIYWTKVALGFVLISLIGYLSFGAIVDAAVERVDPSMEGKIGEFIANVNKWQDSGADAERVKRVGDKLVKCLDKPAYKFRFFADQDERVNAFACPGGIIVVNHGLLKAVDSDDELAGVMAHELGHVVHRDSLRAAVHNMGMASLLAIVFGGAASDERVLALANMVKLGEKLESLSFSRKQETLADLSGVALTMKAGYKPEAFITFFQKLEKDEKNGAVPGGESGKLAMSLLSTHPMTSDRIAAIRSEIERLQKEAARPGLH